MTSRASTCEESGLDSGRRIAREADLEARARFARVDAGRRLPFAGGSFDAVVCIDALNHIPGRAAVFADWARVLVPGGRLLFTDPVTITGIVSNEELATRSSIGYFEFAPPGEDERLLAAAGLDVVAVEDLTETVAGVAGRRVEARAEARRCAQADRGRGGIRGQAALPRDGRRPGAGGTHVALRLPRAEAALSTATA